MKVDLYERVVIGLAIAMVAGFALAIVTATTVLGKHVPGQYGRIDPSSIDSTAPFDKPGVRQTGPGQYEVVLIGQMWSFNPAEVRVPRGSTVTFVTVSRDVVHGFNIERTNANIMLVPGQIGHVTVRFDMPGEHLMICHEYCGIGHQAMVGKIIVE